MKIPSVAGETALSALAIVGVVDHTSEEAVDEAASNYYNPKAELLLRREGHYKSV